MLLKTKRLGIYVFVLGVILLVGIGIGLRDPTSTENKNFIAEKKPQESSSPTSSRLIELTDSDRQMAVESKMTIQAKRSKKLARLFKKLNEESADIPLVMHSVALDEIDLTPLQKQTIIELQEEFSQKISESGMDSNSPEYRQVWDAAHQQSDERLKSLLGQNLYDWYQTEIRNKAFAQVEQSK